MQTGRDAVPKTALLEDDVAPAPWAYDPYREVITDYHGDVVIRGIRALTCERIVRAVNAMAKKDGIPSSGW